MQKNTKELMRALEDCKEFSAYFDENRESFVNESLSKLLNKMVRDKKLTKANVIKSADISEVYGYQIFCGLKTPERGKLLRLLVAMHAEPEETQKLLKSAGYAPLYAKIPFDSVIIYALCNRLELPQINEMLASYDLPPL